MSSKFITNLWKSGSIFSKNQKFPPFFNPIVNGNPEKRDNSNDNNKKRGMG